MMFLKPLSLDARVFPSLLAPLSVAVGGGVGAEWSRSGVGLCQGALPLGAHHAPSLTKISVILEAP